LFTKHLKRISINQSEHQEKSVNANYDTKLSLHGLRKFHTASLSSQSPAILTPTRKMGRQAQSFRQDKTAPKHAADTDTLQNANVQ